MAKPDKSEAGAAPKVAVTLALHHQHAGKPCKPGDSIDVTPAQAQWLLKRGIINTPETH